MYKKYCAICFAEDGDFVRDFHNDSKENVIKEIENMGSRWIFYPIVCVATEKTIVEAPEELSFLKGKRIKTAVEIIKNNEFSYFY